MRFMIYIHPLRAAHNHVADTGEMFGSRVTALSPPPVYTQVRGRGTELSGGGTTHDWECSAMNGLGIVLAFVLMVVVGTVLLYDGGH